MRILLCLFLSAAGLLVIARPSGGQIVGRAVSADPEILVSFDQPDRDYDIPGDMFGVRSRDFPDAPDCFECPGLPFTMVDETFDLFDPRPTDRLGIIRSLDFDPFFGVVDTVNDVRNDWNTAAWRFDIAGHSSLRISADMAAMGDFEAGNIDDPRQDAFVFDYAIDGGPFEILFESSVDTEASLDYEMEQPHPDNPIITLDDPLSINGVMLDNLFQTISADVSGGGNQLELRFRAISNGGEEAFAFRNLIIEAFEANNLVDGDYNASGTVEQGDLDLVLLNWGSAGPPPAAWTNDLPNGPIDQEELDGVLLNWGNSSGAALTGAGVPEPSALALVLLCIAVVPRKMRALTNSISTTSHPHP